MSFDTSENQTKSPEQRPRYETKPLTGSMFLEKQKKDPKYADWNGTLKLADGTEYWINGYNRTAKESGKEFVFLTVKIKNGERYVKKSPDDKTNTGSLDENKNKKDEKHADLRGKINVAGTEYWINGWENTSQSNGKKYIKLSIRPIEGAHAGPESDWVQPQTDDTVDMTKLDIGVPLDYDDTPPF